MVFKWWVLSNDPQVESLNPTPPPLQVIWDGIIKPPNFLISTSQSPEIRFAVFWLVVEGLDRLGATPAPFIDSTWGLWLSELGKRGYAKRGRWGWAIWDGLVEEPNFGRAVRGAGLDAKFAASIGELLKLA